MGRLGRTLLGFPLSSSLDGAGDEREGGGGRSRDAWERGRGRRKHMNKGKQRRGVNTERG